MSEPQLARLPNDDRFDLVDDCRDHYEDDHSGLAAWTDDDGRFFAVGDDGVVRAYGEGDDQRLIDDMARAARFPRPVTLQGRAFGSEPPPHNWIAPSAACAPANRRYRLRLLVAAAVLLWVPVLLAIAIVWAHFQ